MRHRKHAGQRGRRTIARAAASAFLAGAAALVAPAAFAAMTCGANVQSTLAFGPYDTITDLGGRMAITVTCNGNGNASPALSASAGGGTYANRQMRRTGGADVLGYNLYLDSGYTAIWGNGTSGTSMISYGKITNGQTFNTTIYGLIRGGQNVPPGAYADQTITVTLTF